MPVNGKRAHELAEQSTAAVTIVAYTASAMVAPVLLIEDDPSLREVFCEILEAEGYTVVTAPDAETALRLLEEGLRPSVVVVDLHLPRASGWEVMKYMDQESHLRSVPTILMSGMPKDNVKLLADAVFKKPVDVANLLSTIRSLAHRQAPQE